MPLENRPVAGSLVTAVLAGIACIAGHSAELSEATGDAYAIVVQRAVADDASWSKVVAALQQKHGGTIVSYETSVTESLEELRRRFPRYTCFIAQPKDAGRDFVAQVHRLTRKLDDDPYTDTFWGILTGYDADTALAIAEYRDPLTIRRVAAGTEFAMEMVTEGQWYDELVKNKHVKKNAGGQPEQLVGPDDTTAAMVGLLNDYRPDLFIASGHATERDWQIGFGFRSGQFRCQQGQLYGLDTQGVRYPIDSPNPKVYLPIGNCLMGHVIDRDAMALAWMKSAGVKQMLGYTVPTWFGYMGWGVLDYFVEQPGRYTLTEAFFANHHALIHRLLDPNTPNNERRGLAYDRDAVAFYGDPKWRAVMAERPKCYDQKLEIQDGVYTFTVVPRRGETSFAPVNTNGAQRGGRPIVQFLPERIQDVQILAGQEWNPTITDDFILVPNPGHCDPRQTYMVRFRAKPVKNTDSTGERAKIEGLDRVTIRAIDLNDQTDRQVIVDKEQGQYLGHPTTCLLEDGQTILCVYPKGHGRGAIVYKRSSDGGKTWSERLPTPASWATSKEVPTLHRVIDPQGAKRVILWSGLYPARLAVSEDDGQTWSELKPVGDWGGIVVMGFVEPLKTGKGHYLAMFHDDGRFFHGGSARSFGDVPTGQRTNTMTLYKSFSTDGGLTWSYPQAVYASSEVHLCEPGCIRSPDGKQLAVLLRENARRKNSHVIFSNDEGQTWSEPREVPLALTGDRHTGKYAPDGRLFISFRCRSAQSKAESRPFEGDWAGWVGTYDDLVQGRQGQYVVRLKDNTEGYDTAYPGVEVLPDGTFVATTYGHWEPGQEPYILSVRFRLNELDQIAAGR